MQNGYILTSKKFEYETENHKKNILLLFWFFPPLDLKPKLKLVRLTFLKDRDSRTLELAKKALVVEA
jgi:hypothetical protein